MADKTVERPWKVIFLSALGGAIALAIVGFAWGGWTTEGGAKTMAKKAAEEAVLEHLVPICVAQAKAAPAEDLEALKDTQSWSRDDFVEGKGWATMPGATSPVRGVASKCADVIIGG